MGKEGQEMMRAILGFVGGLVAWAVIVTLIDIGLRHTIPGYQQVEPVMAFTLSMKFARLAMAAVTSVAAGYIVRWIAPASRAAPWIVGLVIVALFLPAHIQIWQHFPIWYHLFFLGTLAPFVALGARLRGRIA
jgi:hypothetical protein